MRRATLAVPWREHPALTAIHTWTSVDNAAMQRTNLGFGYRAVEQMHEMQGTIQDPDA